MKISEIKLRESFSDGELLTGLPIKIYDETGSTNDEAKKFAEEGGDGATRAIFIAAEQTAGRGRRGRSFLSPEGGLYMSLLLRPSGPLADAVAITTYAAVTVRRAIAEVAGLDCEIKWVNDLLVRGRKLAGILTEGVLRCDVDTLRYCVVGIGINLAGDLPPEIADIATSVSAEGSTAGREELAARIAELFYSGLGRIGTRELADEYRRYCPLIGRDITVMKQSGSYPARVVGITDSCELLLLLPDGSRETLATGEVSIREN